MIVWRVRPLCRTRPNASVSVAREHAIASVPAVGTEPPRVDVPLPVATTPEHADHAACDVEDVPVAVVEEVALLASLLLGNHLVEVCDECRLTRKRVVRGHARVGLDVLIVGILGEVEGRERDSAQVLDRLRFRTDTRVEIIGHPESRTGFESRGVVGADSVQLNAVVDRLQNGRLSGNRGRRFRAVRQLHVCCVLEEGGEAFTSSLRIENDRVLKARLCEVNIIPVDIRHKGREDRN